MISSYDTTSANRDKGKLSNMEYVVTLTKYTTINDFSKPFTYILIKKTRRRYMQALFPAHLPVAVLVIVVTGESLVSAAVSHTAVGIFVALTRDRMIAYMEPEVNGDGMIIKMPGSLKWIKVLKLFLPMSKTILI